MPREALRRKKEGSLEPWLSCLTAATCTHIHLSLCGYIHIYIYIYVDIYIYICISLHINMHVYKYIYTHMSIYRYTHIPLMAPECQEYEITPAQTRTEQHTACEVTKLMLWLPQCLPPVRNLTTHYNIIISHLQHRGLYFRSLYRKEEAHARIPSLRVQVLKSEVSIHNQHHHCYTIGTLHAAFLGT